MKRAGCPLCFATGFAAATVLAVVLALAWSSHLRVTAASTVNGPLLSALSELRTAAESGEKTEVIRRIERLRRCWAAFANGAGETPELFVPRLAAGDETACAEAEDDS